jgi:Uma2 family endonuclease
MTLPGKKNQHYTYADYLTWDDDERWELIDGVPYAMAGASTAHQRILTELTRQFANFLKGKPCEAFAAPFDVRLNADTNDDTVVQPDLLVICDKSKLDDRGCKGAPDLVIEVLSPSTASHDRFLKFNKYQRAGVREYWIVDPDSRTVQAHVLENGRYFTTVYFEADTAPVHILDGCTISLPDVFEAEV